MNTFGASGVTMPSPESLTIYYNKENVQDLFSKDLKVRELHEQGHEFLKSIAHATSMENTWERMKLNLLYKVDYILYGNFGRLANAHDGADSIFDINEDGPYMLMRITTELEELTPNEVRVGDIIDFDLALLAKEIFLDAGLERCGQTMQKGYLTMYIILPRKFEIPKLPEIM